MTDWTHEIIPHLPYGPDFLFVDTYDSINDTEIRGTYRFKETEYFYAHHFPEQPITPGVILIECMAQIGLIGHAIYLSYQREINLENVLPIFSSSEVEFLKPVYPSDQVIVHGKLQYFRHGKIKSDISMKNEKEEVVCKGTLSGLVLNKNSIV
ncbi:MAG: hydroxymyristoyl-ACP dehydratase [Bacteroidota bacterium]